MDNDFKVADYVNTLEQIFEKNKDNSKAVGMKKYMRKQFEFYKVMLRKPLVLVLGDE